MLDKTMEMISRANWFTSDLHFGHQNIIKFEAKNRPFATVEEHTEAIIERYNAVVGEEDTVVFLGDIIMGDFAANIKHIERLNGFKILVPGNHDRIHPFYHGSEEQKKKWKNMYWDAGFMTAPLHFNVDILGHEVKLSHIPFTTEDRHGDRYAKWTPFDDGTPLITAHVHGAWQYLKSDKGTPMFNVGVDTNNLTPVSTEDVLTGLGLEIG